MSITAHENTANEKLLGRRDDVFMTTYARPPLALARGLGSKVYDADGREYLDLIAGIAVCLLGHAHPRVIEAVTGQLSTLGHTSNLYATEPAVALAEKLLGLLGDSGAGGRIFFCNSGAEANETAIKLTRRTGRTRDHRRRGQLPWPDDGRPVHHRPAGQARALRAAAPGCDVRALRRCRGPARCGEQ